MEFWVRLTIADHGRDEDSGVAVLTALEDLGSVDPLADQNLADGRLSISMWSEGADAQDAVARALPKLTSALDRAGFPMTRLVGLEVNVPAFDERDLPAA